MKKVLFSVFVILSVMSCEQEPLDGHDEMNNTQDLKAAQLKGSESKMNICHYSSEYDTWELINVNQNAWEAHENHGDIRLDDQDGDGYVPVNACGFGEMGDCDDLDAAVNPGAVEICDNGIDDDCDGFVDAEDDDCCATPSPEALIGEWRGLYTPNPNLNVVMLVDECSAVITLSECGDFSMDFTSEAATTFGVLLTPLNTCRTNPNWTLTLDGTTLTIVNANNVVWTVLEKQ